MESLATLKGQEIFKLLRPDQIDAISNAAEIKKFKAGETIYYTGGRATYLYIVLSGQVDLKLPGKEGYVVLIDQLTDGAMFGQCISFAVNAYTLTAQCAQDAEVLKINVEVLRRMMDDDPHIGYAIQTRISEIYFKRYVETMKKLQAIVMNMPIEAG